MTHEPVGDLTDIVGRGSLPPRARFVTDAPVLSLNGEWRFAYATTPASAPEGAEAEDFDDSAWDLLPVPSSWPMHGYGAPAYTNVQFPFPVDPPHVPDANAVGTLRRTFEWTGGTAAVLRLDGVDAAGRVHLNGVELGTTRGSRLPHEFDLTGVLRPGTNVLVLRVAQWAATSYLEDQDMWWLPGVFRDVTIQAAPAGGIRNVVIDTAWDADGGARLKVEVETRDGAAASIALPEFGLQDLAPGEWHRVDGAEPWTNETPTLTEVRVATDTESALLRAGFRSIAIEDAQVKLNGRRVLFRGVNRHEHHPDLGRVVPTAVVREELLLMKRHNINAIRTSHYPPHPDLPDLADELGFLLLVECDLETHGFFFVDWRRNPSDDPAWEPAYLDRMRRTVERDRNHASVVMWSIGNEAGTGRNLTASARLAKQLDPTRPLHYEGDFDSRDVDVYSHMYWSPDQVEAIGRFAEPATDDPDADAHRRSLPFVLCEYAHAMGNGPGGLSEYQRLFQTYPRCQGGFVWEWLEHGIRRRTADGRGFLAYGGDFGEELHDGNFVADGLVDADRRPRPGLADVKRVFAPVELRLDDDGLEVVNRHDHAGLTALRFVWSLEGSDGRMRDGDLTVPDVAAGASAPVVLPDEARRDGVLTVRALLATDAAWADAGHEVAWAQRGAYPAPGVLGPETAPERRDDRIVLGPAAFDAATGMLTALAGRALAGPTLELWRAPTDNDRGIAVNPAALASEADDWARIGLHRLHSRLADLRVEPDRLTVVTRVAPAATDVGVLLTCVWTAAGDRVGLACTVLPDGPWTTTWARVGLRFDLPWRPDAVAWTGLGPGQHYPDTGQAQRLGHFAVHDLADLDAGFVRPQENGARRASHLRVSAGGVGLAVEGDFAFTATPWTATEVAAAAHPTDLPAPGERCVLTIDLAQHGVGTAACGPGVLPQYRLEPREVRGTLVLQAR